MKKKALSLFISAVMLSSVFAIPVSATQTDDYLSTMSTEDKISQMIMPVFRYSTDDEGNNTNVTEITDDIESALEKHCYGGVIVMGQNTPTNEGTTRLTDAMQKANAKGGDRPQLLITIDQEGGTVTRLGQGTVMPGNMALGAANDTSLTKETASMIGSELSAVGINADFAPVVDVNNNPSNPIIGIRSFSDDPQIVAEQGAAFVQALNEQGVISTLKHFPGHGDTDTDSHTGLPLINKSYDEIRQNELVPFQACIDAGSQMIMTAHIQYPQIEKNTYVSKLTGEDIYLPATLSKTIITDILRGDMGYNGVVITDAMEMDAIAKHFDKYDAAKLAIEAGVDILLAPVDTTTKAGFEEMDNYISTLADKADSGEISMEKINAAVKRILALKENNGLMTPYDGSDIESRVEYAINHVGTKENHDKEWEITKKAITLVKNEDDTLPLTTPNQKTVILVPYDDETIPMNYAVRKLTQDGKLPEGAVVEAYSYRKKTLEDMMPTTEGADNVIFLSEIYGASALSGDIAQMADAICDDIHNRGGKFIVMSVNLPYDVARFQKTDAIMLAYLAVSMPVDPEDKTKEMQKYGANMPVALYMMFSNEDAPTAKLPVNIPQLDKDYSYTDTMLYERGFGLTYTAEEPKILMAEHTSINWDRSGDNIVIRTNSESETVAIRIGGGLAGTNETEGVTLENGTVTLSGEFANKILEDGENTLRLVFSDGEIEISIYVTNEGQNEEPKKIMAEHTSIDWDRSGDNIVIRTNSESETVAIRIGGGLAGTNETEGVTFENGTVTLSGEFANKILENGENTLRLVFSDGEIAIRIFVTDTEKEEEPSATSESQDPNNTESSDNKDTSDDTRKADNTNVPVTGDGYPIIIMLVIVTSGCIIAFAVRKQRQKR